MAKTSLSDLASALLAALDAGELPSAAKCAALRTLIPPGGTAVGTVLRAQLFTASSTRDADLKRREALLRAPAFRALLAAYVGGK